MQSTTVTKKLPGIEKLHYASLRDADLQVILLDVISLLITFFCLLYLYNNKKHIRADALVVSGGV